MSRKSSLPQDVKSVSVVLTPDNLLIKPIAELRSNWLNHSLRVAAGGGFGFYSNATSQNYWNGYVQADGRLDIQEDFYITGLIGIRRQTEALGTPNALVASSPTVADSLPVQIGLSYGRKLVTV